MSFSATLTATRLESSCKDWKHGFEALCGLCGGVVRIFL